MTYAPGLIKRVSCAIEKCRKFRAISNFHYYGGRSETVRRLFEEPISEKLGFLKRPSLRSLRLSVFAPAHSRAVFTPQNIHWMFFGTAVSLSRSMAGRRGDDENSAIFQH